jgi:hypothetical protein
MARMFTFTCQSCAATFHSAARRPLGMECQHCGGALAAAEDRPTAAPQPVDARPLAERHGAQAS